MSERPQTRPSDLPGNNRRGIGSRIADAARRSPVAMHRYAIFVAVSVVVLIFFGGQVKSTNAGLSVPDWPNTYGHFMFAFPWEKMVGGIFWEHSHRMIASVVGLLTFVLAFWVWLGESRKWVRQIGLIAAILVVVQGVMGGLTVHFLLPLWASATHGTLAQIFFCLVVTIALVTSGRWKESTAVKKDREAASFRRLAVATTAVIFIQLVVGAVMRHSEAGLVIPDVPTMFGSWIPPLSDARLEMANRELWRMDLLWKLGLSEVTRPQMIVHLLHRLGAVVVTIMAVWTAVGAYRRYRGDKALTRPAILVVGLVFVQALLGILTILTEKQFTIATLHVVNGALTLAASLVLTLRSFHLLRLPALEARRTVTVPEEVMA